MYDTYLNLTSDCGRAIMATPSPTIPPTAALPKPQFHFLIERCETHTKYRTIPDDVIIHS